MNRLFDDFKKYVDAMSSQDMEKSIADAVEHTVNSYILDGVVEHDTEVYENSSTQELIPQCGSNGSFTFCSVDVSCSPMSYELSGWEDIAA
jgi:hypothetical protein